MWKMARQNKEGFYDDEGVKERAAKIVRCLCAISSYVLDPRIVVSYMLYEFIVYLESSSSLKNELLSQRGA